MSNELSTSDLWEELFISFSMRPINVVPTLILKLFHCLVTNRFLRFMFDKRQTRVVGHSFIDVVPSLIVSQRAINLKYLPLH